MEDFHCLLALSERDVLVELMEELVDAHVIDKSSLELDREALLVAHELAGCVWLWIDLNLEGLIAPQVHELLVVVVLDVVSWHFVHLSVITLALPLVVGVDVTVLVLA